MEITRLSVNINKIATLRNARGGQVPNVLKVALDLEVFGAQGITVHPRPDERHIKYQDVLDLYPVLTTEFNIEGYPDPRYLEMIATCRPRQATLVPDKPDAITSNAGWDTITHQSYLKDIISQLHESGTRVSVFVDPEPEMVASAKAAGADRVELYTEPYAANFLENKELAIAPYIEAAKAAEELNIGVNAGHDLNLDNLAYFVEQIPNLLEVSIGHALIADALYYGLENTINLYLQQIRIGAGAVNIFKGGSY